MGDSSFNIFDGKSPFFMKSGRCSLTAKIPEIDFEPGQNPLEEMLELGNEARVSAAVYTPSEGQAAVPIKIEPLLHVHVDGADENWEMDAFPDSTDTKILPGTTTETPTALKIVTVEEDNVEQSNASNYSDSSDWSCSSSSYQQAEREGYQKHVQPQASTSETGHGGLNTRCRKISPQQADGNTVKKRRATKTFTPDELKDEEYWEKRKKNNDAARRSRKLKKLNVSRARLNELIQQNDRLMEQALSSRIAVETFKNNILSVGLDLNNL